MLIMLMFWGLSKFNKLIKENHSPMGSIFKYGGALYHKRKFGKTKQLIASVKNQIRNIFKGLSTAEHCSAIFVY